MMNGDAPTNFGQFAPGEQGQDGGVDFRSIIGVFLRHWRFVVFIPMLAIALTYGGLRLVTPLYKSTVEVLVVDPKQREDAGINRRLSLLDVDNAAISNEITFIESRSLALRIAKELGLDKDQEFQRPGHLTMLAQKLGLPPLSSFNASARDAIDLDPDGAALDRAAVELDKRLQVERVQFSYFVAISITSEDPVKAQRLAQAFANDYLAEQAQARADAVQRSISWLSARLDDARLRVQKSEEEIQKLKLQGGMADVGPGNNLSQQQTADINGQLMAARAELAEKRARYEQARHVLETGGDIQEIPEVVSSSVISQLRFQQSELSQKEADLRSKFGERFPEVVSIRSQQDDIKRAINSEVSRVIGNMKNAYDAAVRREQSLAASLQKLTTSHVDSAAYAKLRDLEPVAEADRKAYETLLAQYKEISQHGTLPDSGARIVTPASLPDEPSSPRPLLIYAIAGVLSMGAAFGLSILVEVLSAGFKTASQVEQALGFHVLGMIPLVRPKWLRRTVRQSAILEDMANAPLSRLSEAVRTIGVGLGLGGADGAPKVVLVTSSVPGEGKSTTAMLLALSSARSGKKTVLVDCDLRHQSISKTFGESPRGLTDVLMGNIDINVATITHEGTGIRLIPVGSRVRNPADLLTTDRMRDVVAQLRLQYDCVIMDASPLLAVVDALALAPVADRVLMVIEWNKTPRAGVSEALKVLRPEAHRIKGIVLTKVDFDRLKKYGYGYGAGYNYGHYYRAIDHYYTGR